jgi:hypothetical protein
MPATRRIGRATSLLFLAAAGCVTSQHVPSSYQGKPYEGVIQQIPGRIACWRYDEGGEGVAYHDRENTNLASICCGSTFRVHEGVDVGVMDHNHRSLNGQLQRGSPYVGWIFEGEWIKYTVQVAETGDYQVNAHMTSIGTNCQIRLAVNGKDVSGPISFSRATRNVHWWDVYTNLAQVHLKAGPQVLTLEFSKGQKGDQNFEWLEFVKNVQ